MSDQAAPSADFDSTFPDRGQSFDEAFPDQPATGVGGMGGVKLGGVLGAAKSVADATFPQGIPMSADQWKAWRNEAPAGRIASAFGHPFTESPKMAKETVEALRAAGIYKDFTEQDAAHAQAYDEGIMRGAITSVREFNEFLTRPLVESAATALEYVGMRPAEGALAATAQSFKEASDSSTGAVANKALGAVGLGTVEQLGRDVTGMGEMLLTSGHMGLPPATRLPRSMAEAKANGVLDGDDVYFGRRAPTDEEAMAMAQAAGEVPKAPDAAIVDWAKNRLSAIDQKAQGTAATTLPGLDGNPVEVPATQGNILSSEEMYERAFLRRVIDHEEGADIVRRSYPGLDEHLATRAATPESAPSGGPPERTPEAREPVAPPTVDKVARQNNPALFNEYDALEGRRTTFARWMRELQDTARTKIEETPPNQLADIDKQIAELEKKAANAGARTRDKFETQLDDLHEQRDAMVSDLVKNDPGVTQVRGDYMAADTRMRDMAPDVSAAYREAEQMLPPRETAGAPEPAPATATAAEAGEAAPGAPERAGEAVSRETGEGVTFTTAKGSTYEVHGDGTTSRNKAARAEHPGEEGPQPRSQATFYVTPQGAEKLSLIQTQGGASMAVVQRPDGSWGVKYLDGKDAGKFERRTMVTPSNEPKVGLMPVEIWKDGKSVHFGNEITEVKRPEATPEQVKEIQEKVNQTTAELEKASSQIKSATAARPAEIATPEQVQAITEDVTKKLVAAGRKQENAEAEAQIIAAYYETRARRFKGSRGTAQEMYEREAPEIRGRQQERAAGRAREKEMAQRDGRELNQIPVDGDYSIHPKFEDGPEYGQGKIATKDSVAAFETELGKKHGIDISLALHSNGDLSLNMIEVPKDRRKQGVGTAAMQDLVDYADENGLRIILSPAVRDELHGTTSRARLVDFYKRAGFVENKGRNKDFAIRDGMYREPKDRELNQSNRGGILLPKNGRKIITMFRDADASTFIHETGHSWLEDMVSDARADDAPSDLKADMDTVRKWLGMDGDKGPTRKQHEKFARGIERYMMEGVAPSEALAGVFEKFKDWLTKIYQTVTKLRSPINDDIRAVFDRLLTHEPNAKPVIAPELPLKEGIGDAHGTLHDTATPEKVPHLARRIKRERETEVANHHPEISDELNAELEGSGAGEAPREGADGGGNEAEPDAGETGSVPATGDVRTGGSQFKDESPRPRPEGARESKLYARVPKEPRRLLEYIKSKGGVIDEGGEVKGILGTTRRSRGLIKDQAGGGQSLEELARDAWENGYFPELGDRQADPHDLLDKLAEDIRGNAQYADHDTADVAAYHDALNHNHEVDRIANELAIDTHTMTRTEFWNKVSERLSEEQAAKQIESLDAARAADREIIEREVEQHESLPESLEPEELAGDGQGVGDAGAGEPGSAGEPAPTGEKPAGQGRSANGHAGGAGSSSGGSPSIPSERFADPAVELVDKAGNIRLDNLNSTEEVNEVLRQVAAQNGDFLAARRGVVTDADVLEFSEALGSDVNIEKLRAMSVEDQVPLAARILAGKKLLIQSAKNVREAMAKAASGDDAAITAYAAVRDRHMRIQETVSGITAEWGRAGRAFHALSKVEGAAEAKGLEELFQSATGLTREQLQREAQLGLAFDKPGQISKYLADAKKPSWWDYIAEYRMGSMLSGPLTQVWNILSNTSLIVGHLGEHAVAAGVGAVRGGADRVHIGEVKASAYGIMQGAQDGWRTAKAILKDETLLQADTPLERRRPPAIPGMTGQVVRYPMRVLGAMDSLFKGIASRMKLNELAYRQAMTEGLDGDALNVRLTQLYDNPSVEMLKEAKEFAQYQTFTNPLGKIGRAISQARSAHPIGEIIFPFVKTPLNVFSYAVERTPLGLAMEDVRARLRGDAGRVAQDEQIARMVVGGSLMTTATVAALNGVITGGGPADADQRAALMLTGWRPYSVKVGDQYYPYSRLEPYATLIGTAADAAEIWQAAQSEDHQQHIGKLIFGSINKNLVNKTYLQGLSDFMEAVSDVDRYGASYFRSVATSFVPNLLNQTANQTDPLLREARTTIDAIKNRVPGLRSTLMPKRDRFGNTISRDGFSSTAVDDPALKEMLRLQYYPSPVERKIRGVELTPQQYDDYARIAGRDTKIVLDRRINTPGWNSVPSHIQLERIKDAFAQGRERAARTVMTEAKGGENDIIAKSRDLKKELRKTIDAR